MADKKPRKSVDASDLVVAGGLTCLTTGAWAAIGVAALVLPGLVLLWYGLPPRPPFVKQDR